MKTLLRLCMITSVLWFSSAYSAIVTEPEEEKTQENLCSNNDDTAEGPAKRRRLGKAVSTIRIVELVANQAMGKDNEILLPLLPKEDTPLHRAVRSGDLFMAQNILETITTKPHFLSACELLDAVASDNLDAVQELLECEDNPANPNGFALSWGETIGDAWASWLYTSRSEHNNLVMYNKKLIFRSMTFSETIKQCKNSKRLYRGFSVPLCVAAVRGSVPMINLLLSHGASVHARCPDGKAPIMAAAFGGNPEAVKVLLQAKADVSATDFYGNTALMYTAIGASDPQDDPDFRTDVFKELLAHGAKPEDQNYAGLTACQMLCKTNDRLLFYWAQVNPRTIMNYGVITPEIDEWLRKHLRPQDQQKPSSGTSSKRKAPQKTAPSFEKKPTPRTPKIYR